ncbi:DUF4843 domain-containing protein [Sphingobacterium faecale]|uniref:DUF4843 domain-containing protein n=1 Tax=Sphingobacterium faecale TaxID=2803775 RepID=A0ABS1R426_9SPHI|nr:DUF4843 domain-containing protein [Sphingobacterium faecale]MBL1409467.1 DUF4843 domain-containing protein [Sphingobacterium faecale]
MMKKIFLFTLLVSILYSCSKEDYITYTEKNGLSFTRGGNFPNSDSITYSFATQVVKKEADTLWVPIALTGVAAQVDRPFRISIKPGASAQEGVHFKLMESVFPADSVFFYYPIVLFRTTDLLETSRTFSLTIEENDNFSLGALSTSYYPSIRIRVSDQVMKPTWWGIAEDHYYGNYSNGKYRFMIEVCGIVDFSQGTLNYPQILNYQGLLRAKLQQYEIDHGEPLRDENDNAITI